MAGEQESIARASVAASAPDAVARLRAKLGPGPFALVLLFISPEADLAAVSADAAATLPAVEIVGCTTAGEISGAGYDEGKIVAIGFPAANFAASVIVIPDLRRISRIEITDVFLRARRRLATEHPAFAHEFALLLVDGLSIREDELVAALAAGAGAMPMIGGSAGDGMRFQETFVLRGGRLMRDAAVLCVLRGICPVRAVTLDHLSPTERRMVVTEADPAARIVRQINAEPAARELARLLGKPPDGLDALTFAAHPLAVRVGSRHHVRAIQRMLPNGDLVFFSAIDEGMVLTITEPEDLANHLERELLGLRAPVPPVAILAFDCILRRIEAEGRQITGRMSDLLRRNEVWGFSTYGEQTGPMHVNHTMTGYAFYPPGTALSEEQA